MNMQASQEPEVLRVLMKGTERGCKCKSLEYVVRH
jgi:hypothetical protein